MEVSKNRSIDLLSKGLSRGGELVVMYVREGFRGLKLCQSGEVRGICEVGSLRRLDSGGRFWHVMAI